MAVLAWGRKFENPASDRKSTRLNSSHLVISYAVFCLKKKNQDLDNNQGVPTVQDVRGKREEQPPEPNTQRRQHLARRICRRMERTRDGPTEDMSDWLAYS